MQIIFLHAYYQNQIIVSSKIINDSNNFNKNTNLFIYKYNQAYYAYKGWNILHFQPIYVWIIIIYDVRIF